jgi:hypothetical protein
VAPHDPEEDLLEQKVHVESGQTQEEKNAPCKRKAGGTCSLLMVRLCTRRPLFNEGRMEEAGLLIKEEARSFIKKLWRKKGASVACGSVLMC